MVPIFATWLKSLDFMHSCIHFFMLPLLLGLTLHAAGNVVCRNAIELGSYGILPWGSPVPFADPTANWLATSLGPVTFYFRYINTGSGFIRSKLHILGFASFQININGYNLGNFTGMWNTNTYTRIPCTFNPVRYESESVMLALFC
jgi:hypothetical protein